jgi:hypothetical protein
MPRVSINRPSRPRIMRQAFTAAMLFAVVAAGSWALRPRTDPRAGSVVVDGVSVEVGARVPHAYRIAYRTETFSGAGPAVSRSTTIVQRPFASRVGDSVESFARHAERGSSFWIAPGPPAADRRPDAVIEEGIEDGYLLARETRRVAGRVCRVFRAGGSSVASSLPRLETAKEMTDVCVDEAGLVLEEVTFADDEITRRTVATSVSERDDGERIKAPKPRGDARQVGSVIELEPDSRLPGGTFWELEDGPKGFEPIGRYSVVPAGQPGFSDPMSRTTVITFVSEVWTRGPDVFVVEQGATQGADAFGRDPNARRVKAGKLGTGELRYSMLASEVRFDTGGTRFARVRGTLPPSELLAIARDLRGRPEGPLRIKE